jgi:hypothetical protein
MPASFANAGTAYASNQTSDTLAFAGNLTAGSTLVALITGWENGTFAVSTVADGTPQSWSVAPGTSIYTGPDQLATIWYFQNNAATNAPTVTVTAAASGSYFRWGIVEVKGVETSNVIRDEGDDSGTADSTPTAVTNATDTVANDAVLAVLTQDTGDTNNNIAGGLTTRVWVYQDFNDIAGEASYQVAGSGGTQTASWTSDAVNYAAAILTLKASAGGGGGAAQPRRRPLTLLGVSA